MDGIRRLVSIRFGDLLVGCDTNANQSRREPDEYISDCSSRTLASLLRTESQRGRERTKQ